MEELRGRNCPVSKGMGAHVLLKTGNTTIEVHVVPTKFLKNYEVVFEKGDRLEVIGSKVKFEVADTIFAARSEAVTTHSSFVIKDGKAVW